MITKNSIGITAVLGKEIEKRIKNCDVYTGSSLNRKKKAKIIINEKKNNLIKNEVLKSMSQRTKSKIIKKLWVWSGICEKLTFVTLTFVNKIEDKKAVELLRKFIDYVKKNSEDFQYLWVAERQTKNLIFKDNIHFHLVTNIYWDIEKYQIYWLNLQKKNGINPRDEKFNPSSVFDVKQLISNNIKTISNYITKYITKNKSKFICQVWNCSKKISALYTSFYAGYEFLNKMHEVEPNIKEIQTKYSNLHIIPVNNTTRPFYNRLDRINKKVWNSNNDKNL